MSNEVLTNNDWMISLKQLASEKQNCGIFPEDLEYILTYRAKLALSEETAIAFLKKQGIQVGDRQYIVCTESLDINELFKSLQNRFQNPYKYFIEDRSGKKQRDILDDFSKDIHPAFVIDGDIQILAAVAVLKAVSDSVKTLELMVSGQSNHSLANTANLALMSGQMEIAMLALTVADVEQAHDSHKRSEAKKAPDQKRHAKVLEAAHNALKGPEGHYYIWDTPVRKGLINKKALAKAIAPSLKMAVRTVSEKLPDDPSDLPTV